MQKSEVMDKVIKILVEHLGIAEEKVKPEQHIQNDLDADSLDTVEIIMAIEEEFDIEIPDEEAEDLFTVEEVVNGVLTKL